MKLEFVERFFKNTQISNFMTILPVGAGLLYEDGQTDIMKLIVALRNFSNNRMDQVRVPSQSLTRVPAFFNVSNKSLPDIINLHF
jgi:hypothetical protein